MVMRRWFIGMAFALWMLASGVAWADSRIQANCQAGPTGNTCVFTNSGEDAGSACATVHVAHRTTQQATDSVKLCSGELQPAGTVTLPLVFPGTAPAAVCLVGPLPSWNNCTLDVRMSDVTVVNKWAGLNAIVWLFVFLTSLGVFLDAKRIGARKGLLKGIGDLSPGGWFACCLFLWILGFPLYLIKRGDIKAAAMAASGGGYGQAPLPYGPPPQGYGPPPQGYAGPPPGYGGPPPDFGAPPNQGGQPPPWQG